MVHNGIEYGDMQLIAEACDLLRKAAGLDYDQMAEVHINWFFHSWGKAEFLLNLSKSRFSKKINLRIIAKRKSWWVNEELKISIQLFFIVTLLNEWNLNRLLETWSRKWRKRTFQNDLF